MQNRRTPKECLEFMRNITQQKALHLKRDDYKLTCKLYKENYPIFKISG